MSNSTKVRFSREGDQFHYLWAARRCLRLLSPTSGLVAISIEGASAKERGQGESVDAGEEVIDVAEYYGSEEIKKAALIRYIQLKHSTQSSTEAWTPSGLGKTLTGLAKRYKALEQDFGESYLNRRLQFWFITNRPIDSKFIETIQDAASGSENRYPANLQKLERFTSLEGERLSGFCRLLRLEGELDAYWVQRGILAQETKDYLPGNDVDAPVQLKELVIRKALPENLSNPTITKIDVLRALGTTEDSLFPAPCRIEAAGKSILRSQEVDLVAQIIHADAPVIIHASSGVGKSVLSQRIKLHLPKGSAAVVYDCYGSGEYMRAGSPRHRHKHALVQIANEMATFGLCDPIIPSNKADNTDYVRAFKHRIRQSIASVKVKNAQSLICIAIDAADNAQIAAREFGDERSFAIDLLREDLLEGLLLVFLCRTERLELLDPPSTVLRLELKPFNRGETKAFLRQSYPDASENDIDEFHRLTSKNPRVQATALVRSGSLSEILRSLGPSPTTVDATIAAMLEKAIDQMRDRVGNIEKSQIDMMCSALAILRPLVPVAILASVSGVHPSTVRSFATDLGQPLLMEGDAIQFRDEPVEAWFRERYRPSPDELSAFIAALQPLAETSAYVASTLPQLMLEAGQLSELVDLALSSASLPTSNPIEKRDVELQRLQFALKASLRAKQYVEGAKLALKAGEETAGSARQQMLLRDNTDLAAALVESDRIQEIVSRRMFGGGWIGSHHAYEAGLLSYVADFRGDARSRLRMAHEWLWNWSHLPKTERQKEQIEDNDIAEIALAVLNLHGPNACAAELRAWRPRQISYRAGRIIARRLVDHSRYDDLNKLASSAGNDLCLLLAITLELRKVHRNPPKETVDRALRLILNKRVNLREGRLVYTETVIRAITALVEAAYSHRLRGNDVLASALTKYLPDMPPHELTSRYGSQRFPLLRAYALRAAFNGLDLQLIDLAHPELRKQLEKKNGHNASRDVQEFNEDIGALLPWHKLWAETFLTPKNPSVLSTAIAEARKQSTSAARISYREDSFTSDEIAGIWLDILVDGGAGQDEALMNEYKTWTDTLKRPLFTPTWTRLARLCARLISLQDKAYGFAQRAFELTKDAKDDAESKAKTYVQLARAILSIDKTEATEYFNRAVEVASKIGDEILDRWQAMLYLAERGADANRPAPEVAYRLARSAEAAAVYNSDHFDWEGTVTAIAGLCPSSCLCILSRWRDRGFGRTEGLLATAIHYLLDHQMIDPKIPSTFVGFRAKWEYSRLLERAFEVCGSQSERENALLYVTSYMRFEEQSSETWQNLNALAVKNDLRVLGIDRLIEFANRRDASFKKQRDYHSYGGSEKGANDDKKDWSAIFLDLDLHTSDGISTAYSRFKQNDPPFYHEQFFSELFARVSAGREAELIRSFSELAEFDLYSFRIFLERLPDTWKIRMAIKSALADLIRKVSTRYCMEITQSRYYQSVPLQTASDLCGIAEAELTDVILDAIGATTELAGAGRLFGLVGLLAPKLSHDEALEALDFSLALFEDVLDENDGDGLWALALAPPQNINHAVAGYIWASLAAPEASLRWEAAHVVRGLCALDCGSVVEQLIELAQDSSGGPFADARFHFYYLHARQWLLIALARAAIDHPAALVSYAKFFVHYALDDAPHVLIQHFSARATLALVESAFLKLDQKVVDRLAFVNKSAFPLVSSKRYERYQRDVPPVNKKSGADRFTFGYDMSQYWFENLADCFGISSSDIESEAEKVICDEWRLSENGHWDKDGRARRGLFRGGGSWHSHGSYPRMDDLNFYLSYHAMMTVAGKLLATAPIHQDPDDPVPEFDSWVRRYSLTRNDGRWLADRRDPTPLEWRDRKDEKDKDGWRWSVAKSDFSHFLGLGEDRLNLWGGWTTISGDQKETVSVYSALVSSDRSASLLSALQTASNPHDYRIPGADDDLEIDKFEFQLKGWVEDLVVDSGLDEFDPWAGEIHYPPLKPAKFVLDLLQIESDIECRVWRFHKDGAIKEILWSQVWGSYSPKDDESEQERGRRLQASPAFVKEFLGKINMDLIVKVEIERRLNRYHYERNKYDGLAYVLPYFRIFILRADGESYSL
jgi:hypothetical protein